MTAELITSISSVIIALAVLFIAYWQGHLIRKHNRLSVTPNLQIHTDQNDEGNAGNIEITLSNSGIGPAIIKRIQLEKNRKPAGDLSNELVYAELKGLALKTKNVRTFWMRPGCFMSEKEKQTVLRIEFESTDLKIPASTLLDKIQQIFDSYEIKIAYESVYGDKFELDTKKQDRGMGAVPS
ncbi:MAG: hypothetical protein K9M54_10050 [Kiritimatiellales bacterium]|nr:hypothetical protein [Kiritimatiellales bacterium]MCF7863339.1 hypothetical protein [Kiritimatiellales bacterium]